MIICIVFVDAPCAGPRTRVPPFKVKVDEQNTLSKRLYLFHFRRTIFRK